MKDQKISPMLSSDIKELAPLILAEIKKSSSVLLHCHPSPDPDSVGSALAMKLIIESLGKKATVIRGDSDIPEAFLHFPGAKDILKKNFFEIDFKDFDLFISVDTASPNQISKLKPVLFPLPIKSIVIDHHLSNLGYADINLIVPTSPATDQIIYLLAKEWNINITSDMAADMFIGLYADTGGLKYQNTSLKSYEIMTDLVRLYPDFSKMILRMENSESPKALAFYGMALDTIEVFLGDKVALSAVSSIQLASKDIKEEDISASSISSMMNNVSSWKIAASLIEIVVGKTRCSFRTNDPENYPVTTLAAAFGGGGHRAAAGATIDTGVEEAKKLIVSKAKELYNL